MNYITAKKLKPKDIVFEKETGKMLEVVRVRIQRPINTIHRKDVFVLCDNNKEYHHSKLM